MTSPLGAKASDRVGSQRAGPDYTVRSGLLGERRSGVQIVEADRQPPKATPGGVIDRVGNRWRDPGHQDFAEAFGNH